MMSKEIRSLDKLILLLKIGEIICMHCKIQSVIRNSVAVKEKLDGVHASLIQVILASSWNFL